MDQAIRAMSEPVDVVVFGASNQVGAFLIPQLLENGHRVVAVSRHSRPPWIHQNRRLDWRQADLADRPDLAVTAPTLLHLAPLTLFPAAMNAVGRVERAVVTSSTSRFSKVGSSDAGERQLASNLVAGERLAGMTCDQAGVGLTVLRPTIIYGAGLDRSLTRLAGLMERWPVMPLPGPAIGLRQPVHAEDIATAIQSVLIHPVTVGRAYDLPGGDTLTYQAMIERVMKSIDHPPRLLLTPTGLLALALPVLRLHPRWRDLRRAMLERVNEDLVFDVAPAARDFGYQPRAFRVTGRTWQRLDRRLD
jgi:uncharacterized protein YbjT (DUF2867 family)